MNLRMWHGDMNMNTCDTFNEDDLCMKWW